MRRGQVPSASMRNLPWPARLFVGAVICGGYTVLATYLPTTIPHPVLFAVVATASAIASGLKLRLPWARPARRTCRSRTPSISRRCSCSDLRPRCSWRR